MLEEGNERSRDADNLFGRDVNVLDVFRLDLGKIAAHPGQYLPGFDLAALVDHIRGRKDGFHLLIGAEEVDLSRHLGVFDFPIRRENEAVLIDLGVDAQRGDETDIGAFRRLNGADATIMGDMHIANFKARAFAIQTARSQCGETTFVDQHRQRIGLIDDL